MSYSYQDEDDEGAAAQPRVRYEGEDTSPTTTRELNGWYAYPIAAEVFAVVAVGTYLRGIDVRTHADDERRIPSSRPGAARQREWSFLLRQVKTLRRAYRKCPGSCRQWDIRWSQRAVHDQAVGQGLVD